MQNLQRNIRPHVHAMLAVPVSMASLKPGIKRLTNLDYVPFWLDRGSYPDLNTLHI